MNLLDLTVLKYDDKMENTVFKELCKFDANIFLQYQDGNLTRDNYQNECKLTNIPI